MKYYSICIRVSNRTWTRTVNPNEPFYFGEPEPNLNQQNFTSLNLNQTWTLKIGLKWTQTEPEPLTEARIYFSISGCRWRWYTLNKSSGDHQQDQQFLLFFTGRNEQRQLNFKSMNPNRTWTSNILLEWTWTKPKPRKWTAKIFWAGAKPEPEPLFETVRHPNLHYFKYKIKKFKTILKDSRRKAPKLSEDLQTLLHACTDGRWLQNVLDSIFTWRRCVVFLSWRKVCKVLWRYVDSGLGI